MSSDEKLKKINHCRGLIGQLHVDSPRLKIHDKVETTIVSDLTTMLVGLLEDAHITGLQPMVSQLVKSAMAICHILVQSSLFYEVMVQIPGNRAEKLLPFDGTWMEKALDNAVNEDEGVDLVLRPGLARYGGPDADNWRDRVVMVKAEVMAEEWRELDIGS